jgi:RNA polymerase sigma factor (sigma-70 family)
MSALFRGTSTAAFDGLYRRHAATVYRYSYALLGNHADAEDVTQQTFLNAYRSIEGGTKPRKAENWLLTIAHNEVRQHFRSSQSKPQQVELDDRLAEPQQGERTGPTVADILRALQHLPETQRAAIVMREFEGRSYAEMAQILEVTPSALEALVFRARRSLAEQLEGALTCDEAERALSRKLDGRLPRRDARRLKAHMRECTECARFDHAQRRQRTLIKGLSVLPVPASLILARGETAAAALGLGAGAAAAGGGSAAVAGGGGLAGGGLLAGATGGIVVKAAVVTAAAATVVGGVGSGAAGHDSAAKVQRKAEHAAAVAQTRKGARAAEVAAAKARGERPGPARPASSRARLAATKAGARAKKAEAAAHSRRDSARAQSVGALHRSSRAAERAAVPVAKDKASTPAVAHPNAVAATKTKPVVRRPKPEQATVPLKPSRTDRAKAPKADQRSTGRVGTGEPAAAPHAADGLAKATGRPEK